MTALIRSPESMSILGALGVISGVVIKDSMEAMNKNGGSESMLGTGLFVLGWALVAHSISKSNGGYLPYGAALVIVASVMMMKMTKQNNNTSNDTKNSRMKKLALCFVIGWLLLAYSIGSGRVLALFAALLVFASMMYFLPRQRKHGIVDGPGWPLFVIGWVMMIVANSPSLQRAMGEIVALERLTNQFYY